MSADRWSICPKCKERVQKEHDALILKVGQSYGKISPEEYLAKVKSIPDKPQFDQTLREDYEIYWDSDYILKIIYSAGCRVCGLKFSFSKTVDIRTGEFK